MFPVSNTKAHFRRIFTFLRFIMSWFIFFKVCLYLLFILYIPCCNSTTYIKTKIIKQMQRFRLCRSAAEKLSETSRQIHHYFEPDDTFGLWQCCSFFAEKNHLIEQKSNLQIKQPKQSKFKAKQRSAIKFTWFLRITLCLFHLLDCACLQFLGKKSKYFEILVNGFVRG